MSVPASSAPNPTMAVPTELESEECTSYTAVNVSLGGADAAPETTQTYTLFIRRFVLIDTAEDAIQWANRARKQWGGTGHIAVRVSTETLRAGSTSLKSIQFGTWSGIAWDDDSEGIVVPVDREPLLMLEVVGGSNGQECFGLGVLHTCSIAAEGGSYSRYCVHMFPTHAAMDSQTVHAIVEAELYGSRLDAPPLKNAYAPLEYNFGSVRVSTLDFYFPSFLLTGKGEYIVSNVLCAINMTESSSLAMQLVCLNEGEKFIVIEPAQVITVRPQQRVYFCATWQASQGPCMKELRLRLLVNGSQPPSASIFIRGHNSIPRPLATDTPYHYWVNTTCATNRQLSCTHELPFVHSLLPVFRMVNNNQALNQNETLVVALDRDSGRTVIIQPNGVPMERLNTSFAGPLSLTGLGDLSMRDEVGPTPMVPRRGPRINIRERTTECIITLGTIRGFPMVYEAATGVSPSFQISVTLLDQKGWQVIDGETRPSYQSASGSLRWDEKLVLRKWPGASATQFLRLNLTEVNPRDGDETPMGAGIISLGSLERIPAVVPLRIAFYVYETYSLYDTLNTSSLLMRDACIHFKDLVSIA